jgi:CubicO group peptidase (beta-lactamase class C family)
MTCFSRAHLWAVLVLLMLHGWPAQAQRRPQPADPLAGLDAYITQAMQAWEIPGMAVAIVKDDQVVYAKGFGVRQVGKPEPVDANTLFAVASNTKAVTATALGLLVAEGKVAWDNPVTHYLPTLQLYDPWTTRELTVRDLLCHRAGYSTWAGDLMWYGSTLDGAEVLRRIRYLKPDYSFRSHYGYSNLMFHAAGMLIEQVSGQPWATFVQTRLLQPLRMSTTTTTVNALSDQPNVAQPHTRLDGQVMAVPYRNVDNIAAAGALNSSVREWANWLRMQLNKGQFEGQQVVPEAVIQETRVPNTPVRLSRQARERFPTTHFSAYGMGWFLRDYHGRLLVEHTGGMDGMVSQTALLPEENLGVAIFTNQDEQGFYVALMYRIFDAYLGVPPQDWSQTYLDLFQSGQTAPPQPTPGTQPSLPTEAYAGTYGNSLLGNAVVTEENGTLHLRLQHHPGLNGPLRHWHYDTFEADWDDPYFKTSLVTFTLDATGAAATLRFKVREDFVDPLEYTFTRTMR